MHIGITEVPEGEIKPDLNRVNESDIIVIFIHGLTIFFLGIVQCCYLGIGFGAGSIFSGFAVESIGGSWTFLVFGGVTVIMVLFSVVTQLISQCLKKVKETQQAPNEIESDSRNL